ncbi:ABC transporter ATP-binding protein [Frigoriglobus tundricola]|uniref:Teichoic acid export ATP-binding protein TagH n=1 Tax=Frigoriglobus tundricola TaxID=2774151 RepID=A0A6M5YXP6_9BACT|nr:ABC transporter ATP-binding protein [Frigoriglobus tundricola]QJW98051.1 Teichoic acid export ATP-binding protein TagH [Frigoriglobus tundricola]
MTAPAIRVERLGKRYRLAHAQEGAPYRTLRESIMTFAAAPFRKRGSVEEFWALDDVSFEVQPGEVVGVIGRNGAGKSTLLKILSRITKPTTGRVELNGRVGSLLEVGTGFHPELTGRENVYLNGSILGMSRAEIARKFDEIVAFAEVEKFLDTPVKRYSSGMYVRLAFAVAAHLEPEILIIDEVLAVGDAVFQRRCINRMAELSRSGRSLIFVSHQLDIIKKLCKRGVRLVRGRIEDAGPIEQVIQNYQSDYRELDQTTDAITGYRTGNGKARFERLKLIGQDRAPTGDLRSGQRLAVEIEIGAQQRVEGASIGLVLRTLEGARIVSSLTEEVGFTVALEPGPNAFVCSFEPLPLRPGRTLALELWLFDGDVLDHVDVARIVDVVEGEPTEYSSRADQGALLCPYTWARRAPQ